MEAVLGASDIPHYAPPPLRWTVSILNSIQRLGTWEVHRKSLSRMAGNCVEKYG